MDKLQVHLCIWNEDVVGLRELLQEESCNLEHRDPEHQNTPLQLAIKSPSPSQQQMIRLLLAHGADVHARDASGWNCAQNATLVDDDALLALLYMHSELKVCRQLQQRVQGLEDALAGLQDFSVQLCMQMQSWVPFVSALLPSDTLTISKRKTTLRIDYTIKGYANKSWSKGSCSQMLQNGQLIMLDHDERTRTDLSKAWLTMDNVRAGVELLYTCQLSKSHLDAANIEFHRKRSYNIVEEGLPCQNATLYMMKNLELNVDLRPIAKPGWQKSANMEEKDNRVVKLHQFMSSLSKATKEKATQQESKFTRLDLQPGQTVEMRLPVLAGDHINWTFNTRSKHLDFAFLFCDGQSSNEKEIVISQVIGVANQDLPGTFVVETPGSVILRWFNFHLVPQLFHKNRRRVVVYYIVNHIRPSGTVESAQQNSGSVVHIPSETDNIVNQFQRPNHTPKPKCFTCSFDSYFNSSNRIVDDKFRNSQVHSLIFPPPVKTIRKKLEAKVVMAQDFPFDVHNFLPIVKFLSSTGEHVKNLENFFSMKLPDGFPINFDLPVFPTIRASCYFQNLVIGDVDESLFTIPIDYVEG